MVVLLVFDGDVGFVFVRGGGFVSLVGGSGKGESSPWCMRLCDREAYRR